MAGFKTVGNKEYQYAFHFDYGTTVLIQLLSEADEAGDGFPSLQAELSRIPPRLSVMVSSSERFCSWSVKRLCTIICKDGRSHKNIL